MALSFEWSLSVTDAFPAPAATGDGATVGEDSPRDVKLDATTGDAELNSLGDWDLVSGIDGIVSDLKAKLQTVLGEYFLDTSRGIGYFTEFADRPQARRLDAIFRGTISSVAGITSIERLEISRSQTNPRELEASFAAVANFTALISVTLSANAGGV